MVTTEDVTFGPVEKELAKELLKDARVVLEFSYAHARYTTYKKPDGSVWAEFEGIRGQYFLTEVRSGTGESTLQGESM